MSSCDIMLLFLIHLYLCLQDLIVIRDAFDILLPKVVTSSFSIITEHFIWISWFYACISILFSLPDVSRDCQILLKRTKHYLPWDLLTISKETTQITMITCKNCPPTWLIGISGQHSWLLLEREHVCGFLTFWWIWGTFKEQGMTLGSEELKGQQVLRLASSACLMVTMKRWV